jgi:bacillithiol biosynthesis cysteine-adding enzyme BshC
MEIACLRHSDLPGTSRLFLDYQYHFDRVSSFYSASPWDFESYRRSAEAVSWPADRRAAVVAALRRQNGNHRLLDDLAREGTVAVVTGQQIGLFTGPAYSVYKALTAIRLADRLKEAGISAVPVFWLATGDHDFAEINEAWLFDGEGNPVRVQSSQSVSGHRPVGSLILESLPFAELEAALSSQPFGEQAIALAKECYQPGRSWAEAFRSLLTKLLAPREIVFIDSMDPVLREIAAPLLARAVQSDDVLSQQLLDRDAALEKAGYHVQVHFEASTSLVFLLEGGERLTLRRHNGNYAGPSRRYSRDELAANSAELSPNALMRPVMQDFLLPTVAYVGGPAELAYLAQSAVIYKELLGRMPVAVSRTGFTIIDGRASRIMNRFGLSMPDVLAGEAALRDKIARAIIPPHIAEAAERARSTAAQALASLKTELASFDPTLAAAATRSESRILHQFSRIAAKTAREAMRRNERASAEARYLSNLIFPRDHLQERLYSGLAMLARYGPSLAPELYDHVHLDCPDHRLVYL